MTSCIHYLGSFRLLCMVSSVSSKLGHVSPSVRFFSAIFCYTLVNTSVKLNIFHCVAQHFVFCGWSDIQTSLHGIQSRATTQRASVWVCGAPECRVSAFQDREQLNCCQMKPISRTSSQSTHYSALSIGLTFVRLSSTVALLRSLCV